MKPHTQLSITNMQDIYENGSSNEQIAKEAVESWVVDRIEYEGGIKIYLKGCDYPYKGMTTPDALFAINQIKKILLTSVKTFHIFLLFFSKQKLVDAFNTVCWGIISPYTLKRKYRTEFTIEIGNFLHRFMASYGISGDSSKKFANIIAHIFEYDNAYRLRLQDLFTASSYKSLHSNPRKELKRLLELNRIRDFQEANLKFKLFATLLSLVMLSPRANKSFRVALEYANFKKLHFGKTLEQRKKMLKGFNVVKGKPLTV